MTTTPSVPNAGPSSTGGERRGDKRLAVSLMRAAKLVCQSGEYVCLMRDLSPGGVRISLFHDVPAETHVFLELANGDVHAMIRAWQRGTLAGYQFATPIDPAAFIATLADTRNPPISLRVSTPAMVLSGGVIQPAVVTSLAQGGAQIDLDGHLALSQSMILSVAGVGEFGAWVRSRHGRHYEVAFQIVSRLDQLAATALALQPLAPAPAAVAMRGVA